MSLTITLLHHLWLPLRSDCWLFETVTYSLTSSDTPWSITFIYTINTQLLNVLVLFSSILLSAFVSALLKAYETWCQSVRRNSDAHSCLLTLTGTSWCTHTFHSALHCMVILHTESLRPSTWAFCLLLLHKKERDNKKTTENKSY